VAAAADCNRQIVLPRERERGDDVLDRDGLRDVARTAVDHRVEERYGVLVVRVTRLVQPTLQAEAELVDAGCGA
jgi:hypothetical protein